MILCANPSAQFLARQAEIEAAVLNVMRGSRYILGVEVAALESEFAAFIGVSHAVGVANGTDALELALRALDIGPGDEVITVSHTAVATVAAIEATGAAPVLVDVVQGYYTLNPSQLGEVLSTRTRAVIAVHIYGQPADLDEIGEFCSTHGLSLIEDVSQAHGAKWNGLRLGSIGRVACFSCYPTKNLGGIGDAGLVTTNDKDIAQRVRMLREYGWRERYVSEFPGRNSRLDELQAAILRVKLRYLDVDNERRHQLAKFYTEALAGLPLTLPDKRAGTSHVFHLYVIRCLRRQELFDHLKSQGVFAGIHYPLPVHLQPAYSGRVRLAADLTVTESLANEVLSLPMYPQLEDGQLQRVVDTVKFFFNR